MKITVVNILLILCLGFVVTGCHKNYTKYYPDAEDKELAIFSSTGNNVMTCYVNHKPWRTEDRETAGELGQLINSEVYLRRQNGNATSDTLIIQWFGDFNGSNVTNGSEILLHLALPNGFSLNTIASLQGQRIKIDSSNGYFSTNMSDARYSSNRGSGNIYFHSLNVDFIAPNSYGGIMSGLFEADFTTFKIERGRFDHSLSPNEIRF